MTRNFLINGLKAAPEFIADLRSKEYLEYERQKAEKKLQKRMKKDFKKK